MSAFRQNFDILSYNIMQNIKKFPVGDKALSKFHFEKNQGYKM